MRSASAVHAPSGAAKASGEPRAVVRGCRPDQGGDPARRDVGAGGAVDRPELCQSPTRTLTSCSVPGTFRTQTASGDRPRWTTRLLWAYCSASPIWRTIDSCVFSGTPLVWSASHRSRRCQLRVVGVDQADTELGLDEVAGTQQAVMLEPGHDPELVLGDRARGGLVLLGGRRGRTRNRIRARSCWTTRCVGEPVLPALAVVDRLVLDHPGAGLALPALHQADAARSA